MIGLKNKIRKIGAGFMAGLCAFSILGTTLSSGISASAANTITTENSAFPSADEVIAQAATLLGSPYGWGFKGYTGVYYQGSYSPLSLDFTRNQGVDCSGLIYYTLTHLGYKTSGFSWNNPVPVDTAHWLTVNDNCTISYGGITSKIDVEKANIPCTERPYWECADGSIITPGSVVIADNLSGEDHSWIYMGEFENRDEVVDYLRNIGVNESYINNKTVGDGSGDGGTHWRIESNGSNGCVINNRTDGKKATAMNMYAFRITKTDVKFSITKVLSTDNSIKISGTSPIDNTKAVYGVYTDKECKNKVGEITIGDDGTGSIILPDKQYYVKEISAPTGYDLSTDVVALKANSNVNVQEDITSGIIRINKTAEDGVVSDREFKISWTENGVEHSKNVLTNTDGIAEFNGLHVYDFGSKNAISYNIAEVNTEEKYVIPKAQDVTLTSGDVDLNIAVNFENKLKKFTAEVVKRDSENGDSQGDGTLSGAVYGLYLDGVLVDTYTTDSNGYFKTKEYVCGNYTIQEISPSEGYLLDETVYPVGAKAENYTIEHNSISMTVTEDVLKGNISIIKHSDDGSTQIETPEVGAEFEVYLKSAESYANAKDSEKEYLVCDENGFAQTKDMPYGVYTVHQTVGWENTEWMDDFEVIISENEKEYFYLINDAVIKSYVKIMKKDAETGNMIPVSGIGFMVWDCANNCYISQKINYPSEMTLDTFYTDETGTLMLPNELAYGDYELHEVQSANGYVMDKTPVSFTIDGTEKTVVIEMFNTAQKGRISVQKTGEVFNSVNHENDEKYTPIFEEKGLENAAFQVIAVEDIITPDGTVRAKTGDVAAEIVTDENGYAETDLLYLGKYEIKEVSAPYGYVKNPEIQAIELTYAGQEIAVTDAVNCAFKNDYQGVEISLEKFMESDEKYGISAENSYKNVRFGLFADEKITAADGSIIPENGLIAEVSLGEDMKAVIAEKLPFARYYVQEIATDEHYILNGEKYLVNFEYMGQDMAKVSVDCGQLVNELKRGTVKGIKVNESDEPLENALFGLFNTNCTEFTVDDAILTAKSDKQGKFEFSEVVYGEYIVREIEAPTGYILSNESYPVTISEDGEIVEISAKNKPITVEISKRDVHGNELIGAEMQLLNSDGKTVEKWTSDGTNHVISGLPAGKYVLKETAAPDGYIIAPDIEFEVFADGSVSLKNAETTAVSEDGNPLIVMVDEAVKIPETPNTPWTPSSPPTGDTGRNPIGLIMVIAGLCGLTFASIIRRKRKNEAAEIERKYAELCPDFIERNEEND